MLSIRSKSLGFLVAGASAMTAAQLARARGLLYTINSGSDVYAQDSIGGVVTGASDVASSGAALAATPAGPFYATTSLSSTNSSLSLSNTDVLDGTAGDYSQSQWAINFTPTRNLDYSIAGTYSSQNANSLATYNVFLTQSGNPLYSGQLTDSRIQNLNLNANVPFTGALTGVLHAGVQYTYSGTSNIMAPAGSTGGDTATGGDSISFSAVPAILPSAFVYQLLGTPTVAGGGVSVPNPGVEVSLNPQPLPPFPDPGAMVDLTSPGDPVYTNPTIASSYEIDFGMDAGGAVSFTVPNPSDPNNFSFTGTGPTGDPYNVAIQIGGGVVSPGSLVELNPQPLPPFPDPGYGFIAFDFSLEGAADPTLTFQVSSGSTDFGFAPVPEPASLVLLGIGAIGLLHRRPSRV